MDEIKERLAQIQMRVNTACQTANRSPDEITLLLATKTVPAEKITQTLAYGETLLGENKVQELEEKYSQIDSNLAEWHFIGNLQSNKINSVIPYVTCIQSIDRLKLGRKLHNRLVKENKEIDIFIQVNTSYEESKFGVAPEDTLALVEQLAAFDTLHIKGLMTIGKLSANPEDTRKCFRLLKSIQEQVIQESYPGVEMKVLSMGMSNDLETAIEEGSTMVRVGTAIFGEREHPDSYYWNEQTPNKD